MTNSTSQSSRNNNSSQSLFALVAFIVFLNIFFFKEYGNVRFAFEVFGFFLFILGVFLNKHTWKKHVFLIGGTAVALFFSVVIPIHRAYVLIEVLYKLFTFALLLSSIYLLSRDLSFFHALAEFVLMPLHLAKTYMLSALNAVLDPFAALEVSKKDAETPVSEQDQAKSDMIRRVILGVVLSIPIVIILLSMLSSADAIYANFLENLFKGEAIKDTITRLVISAVLFVVLLPFLYFRKEGRIHSPIALISRFHFVHEITIVMGLVSVVLASFLIIQWPYIFANVPFETDLSKVGVATYSEYVRRGFIELLKVSAFVYSLIWLGLIALRGRKTGEKTVLTWIQMVVIAEFFVFVSSIFRRIWLYQELHGWSLVRIYGGFFLIWLIGITVFLAARHYVKKSWVVAEILFTCIFIVAIGFFNAEKFIVENHPPTVNKRIDYVYLSRISADGYEGWKQAYTFAKTTLTRIHAAKNQLIDKKDRQQHAYSGMILHNLLRKYDYLTLKHGTEEEIKEYYRTILPFHRAQIVYDLNQIKVATAEAYIKPSLERDLAVVDSLSRDLQQNDIHYLYIKKSMRTMTPSEFQRSFSNEKMHPLSMYDTYDLSDYIKTQKDISHSSFNKFLQANKNEKQAYEKLKKELPLSEVLALSTTYLDLYHIISQQPDNERNFDMDISLDTPLLTE